MERKTKNTIECNVIVKKEFTKPDDFRGVLLTFYEGMYYSAVARSPDWIQLWDIYGEMYTMINSHQFLQYFQAAPSDPNVDEFHEKIQVNPEEYFKFIPTKLKENINNLNILLKWRKKQLNQN